MTSGLLVRLSELDELRFGYRTAKAEGVSQATLDQVLSYCHAHDVEFLIARCPVQDLAAAQAMEQKGFLLMDTLVYFMFSLEKQAMKEDRRKTIIRSVLPGEEESVRAVASRAFEGYQGHYHADKRLDKDKCDEVYSDWAYRSAKIRDSAAEVLVAVLDESIAGFVTVRSNDAIESEVNLIGVAPQYRRQGIFRSLMLGALNWARSHGAKKLLVSTQITNGVAQKAYEGLGFEHWQAYYTFHKWF